MERIRKAEFIRSAHAADQLIEDGRPQVGFVGRSNVGKSSLMNRLLGRKGLAKTSSTPGRTQAVNYFLMDDRFYFVDLPGYGYAKTSKQTRQAWARLMDRYFESALPDAEVVLLVDGKIGGTHLDREAWEYLTAKGADPMVVATKIDKVPKGKRQRAVRAVRAQRGLSDGSEVIEFSAVSGEGVRPLWRAIAARLEQHTVKEQVTHV